MYNQYTLIYHTEPSSTAVRVKVFAHWVRHYRPKFSHVKNKYDIMLCQSRLHTASKTFICN